MKRSAPPNIDLTPDPQTMRKMGPILKRLERILKDPRASLSPNQIEQFERLERLLKPDKIAAAQAQFEERGRQSQLKLNSLISQLGVKIEKDLTWKNMTWKALMAACKELNLPTAFLMRHTPRSFREIVEGVLEIRLRWMLGGDPTSGEKSIIASLKGKQARGTKGSKNENALPVKVDQELLGARRGERSYTAFARYLRLRRTTYVNIEKTGRTTLGKALDIADRLKVSPDHLLK